MEARAIAKYIRMSPIKVGVVLNLIKGKSVKEASAILQYTPREAAVVINKVLNSAVANAENNFALDTDKLYVSEAYVGQGPTLKRFRPRAKGRTLEGGKYKWVKKYILMDLELALLKNGMQNGLLIKKISLII